MKNKSTKHALLASILSIVMCFAMLISSTFAWFTDEVKSGMNKIVAGNLDVELEYSLDGTTWTAVNETTNMFKEDALWEPGYTEVVYLRVSNVGSLALKYQFGINVADKVIGKTADDKDIDLSDFIEFGVVETEAIFADRAAARAAVDGNTALISAGYSSAEGHLIAGEKSNILALVVYMPETVDNAANYAGDNQPSINLGIKLVATQDAVENDSFGDDYDEDSEYLIVVNTVDELNNAIGKLQAGDSAVIEMNDNIGLNAKINIPEGVTIVLDMKNHKIGHETTEQIGVTPLVNSGNLTVRNAEIYSKDGMLNSTPAATANAVLTSLAGNVVLEKCKLTNFSGRATGSYCVGISGGTVTLNDCIIDGYRGGISLGGDAVLKASKCTVNAQFYYPVYMYGYSTADFINCTFNKCKVENPLNPNQAGNAGLIFDNRENDAPIVKFDTCTFNSTWKDGQSVPLEVSGKLTGMIFTDCVFGDNITGLPN